jgi:surface polysaccharide O-acyltransferase-like enzyme
LKPLEVPTAVQGTASNRTVYFDVVNVFACFCVVFLHHNGVVHDYAAVGAGTLSQSAWTQALVIEVVAFFAVPLFLMLTGATLMEYRRRYDTKTFFKKRVLRVVAPFLIWSALYLAVGVWRGSISMDVLISPVRLFDMFMLNQMNSVFWFFPVLIGIYLAMPVLSLLAESKYRRWLWYTVGVGFLTYSLLPVALELAGLSFNTAYALPLTGGGFVIYPILGYLLSTTRRGSKPQFLVPLVIGAVLCLLLRFFYTYYFAVAEGVLNTTFFNYLYFTAMIPAAAIFLVARRIEWQRFIRGRGKRLLAKVAGCSFGVYLLHIMVMAGEQLATGVPAGGMLWRLTMPLATYLLCVAVVLLAKSNPVTRRLFP